MRIARVLTRMNLGGPARQVLACDPILQGRGHQVRLLVGEPEPGEGDLFDDARARGLDVRRIPGLRRGLAPLADLRARAALTRELRAAAPQVVHTHASKAGVLGRSAAQVACPRAARVHSFHGHVLEGYFPRPLGRLLARAEGRLSRRTDLLVAVSEATAADLVRLGVAPREQLVVVPPGVELEALLALPELGRERTADSQRLRAALGLRPEDLAVLCLGRLAAVKRPELALQAFAAVAARQPRAVLLLAGDGERAPSVARLRAQLPAEVRSRVHLLGARRDLAALHGAADLALLSSRSEGLPVALLEAAAAARPAVATAVGGVPELVRAGLTGWPVSPVGSSAELVAALAAALDAALGDAQRRADCGRRARERVREAHGPRALADALERTYERALEAARRRTP
jgi:glycosyltransferase involved in cell wall biosynthesis